MKDRDKNKSASGNESESEGKSLLLGGVVRRQPGSVPVTKAFADDYIYETHTVKDYEKKRLQKSLGNYYKKEYEVLPDRFVDRLLDSKASVGQTFLKQYIDNAKEPRFELGRVKDALFYVVMSNERVIHCLKPERYIVKENYGLFKKNEVKWRIKDCALKTIFNYGSKSHKQHKEDDPTATLKKIYELLEKRYLEDGVFADDVNNKWERSPKDGPGKKSHSRHTSSDSK